MAAVVKVEVEPNDCALTAPLTLCIHYRLGEKLARGVWDFSFVVDFAHLKQTIELAHIEQEDLAEGEQTVTLALPSLSLGHLPPSALHNVALICCQLRDPLTDSTLLTIPLVTHVNVDEDALTVAHTRRIFWNPV